MLDLHVEICYEKFKSKFLTIERCTARGDVVDVVSGLSRKKYDQWIGCRTMRKLWKLRIKDERALC